MSKWVEAGRTPAVVAIVALLGLLVLPAGAQQPGNPSATVTPQGQDAAGALAVSPAAQDVATWAQAIRLTVADAVQHALVRAPELALARLAVAEAEIAWQEAVIGRLVGQPESQYRAARDKVQEARDGYTDQLVQVALKIEEAYYNVLRTGELLQIQQGNQAQADRQLAVARARFEAGLIARQDFLEAELSHAQSLASLETAQRSNRDAWRQLAELMGMPEDAPLLLVEEVSFDPLRLSLEDALAEALAQRAEVLRAQRAVDQARQEVAQADTPYAAPVELVRARLNLERAEMQYEQARTQVIQQVRQEWYALADAERKVEMNRRQEELTRNRAEISRARYEAGLIALLDLLKDEAAYAQARLDAAAAVWDYNLAKARFLRTLGRPELPPLPAEIAEYMAGWEDLE